MISRRRFLQHSGKFAFAGVLFPQITPLDSLAGPRAGRRYGLQLFTVAQLMNEDPRGTLEKLAVMGYQELESASYAKGNYYGYTPMEFAKIVKDLGMVWRSEHVMGVPTSMESIMKMARNAEDSAKIQKMAPMLESLAKAPNLRDNATRLADEAAEGGLSYMVCAAIGLDTMDDIKKAVDIFNRAGEACKKVGVQFCYHNHSFEFKMMEGVMPYSYLLDHCDKDLVKMEMDLGWTIVSGQDPVSWFKKYPGRFPLWHVKDMEKASQTPVEIGTGYINFRQLFDQGNLAGMKHFFIEQDDAPKPLENAGNSIKNLKKALA